mgnify:CR=1 FL=1
MLAQAIWIMSPKVFTKIFTQELRLDVVQAAHTEYTIGIGRIRPNIISTY